MAPIDEELLRYALDNDVLATEVQEHLEQCGICQQRLAVYQRTNNFLLAKLYRSRCPAVTTLGHYCAELLPANQAISITEHLTVCPLCAAEVAETRLVLASFEPYVTPSLGNVGYAANLRENLPDGEEPGTSSKPMPHGLLNSGNVLRKD